MSAMPLLLVIGAMAIVVWAGRHAPLTGARKTVAMVSRLVALLALCAALWGITYRRTHELPRRVIYLIDRSASIDDQQLAWTVRRIASLEALRPAIVERATVVFGATTRVALPVGTERLTDLRAIERLVAPAQIDQTKTNLEAGLLASLALLEAGRGASIVLFSDGRETAGNITEVLSYVRQLGIEVFPVAPPVSSKTATVWEELIVPPTVRRGASVPVQLVIWSNAPGAKEGQVTVSLKGIAVKRQSVAIRPGWQVISVPVPAVQRGTMALEVRLAVPQDGLLDERRAFTEVEGPPRILMVTDRSASLPALATALRRRDMELAFARPQELPMDAGQLLDDDAILLFNVPKSSITAPQADALRAYLEASGGLVTVGLGGDLAQELNTPAPLDPLLPIQFEPKGLEEAKRRVCMVMLIDRSNSMAGLRIAASKRAAVELVKQLSPEDLVGILAFDTVPYVVAEVQQAGQVGRWIVEKLVKLRAVGGTDIYPALAAAANRLELTDAKLKHIILLSDGNTPVNVGAYKALLELFQQDGVTISTIGIAPPTPVDTAYLQWLAKATGGTYYELRSLDELPSLIARDTQEALGRLPFTEGLFKPSRAPTTEWFAEVPDLPSLRGYLTATAKPGATVDVTVTAGSGDDPLFARWQLGKGRVVSFASDADTRWSPDWIRWHGFDASWAQVMRWAMRPRLAEELFVRLEDDRGTSRLILEGELHEPQGALVTSEGDGRIPLSLIETGQWRWHASLDQVPSGWYQLVVESRVPEGAALSAAHGPDIAHAAATRPSVFAKRWIQIGTPPVSKELTGQPPREALLRQIARATDGAYDTPDLALLPPTTRAVTREPLLLWWLALAMLALLVDVAVRGNSML